MSDRETGCWAIRFPLLQEEDDENFAGSRVITLYNEKLEAGSRADVHSGEGYAPPGHRWRKNRVKLSACPLCLSFGHHRKENCGDGSKRCSLAIRPPKNDPPPPTAPKPTF